VTDLVSQTAGLSGRAWRPFAAAAGVLSQREYQKVTTNFNKSPLSLKKSKPSKTYRKKNPDALAAWDERVRESKLAFISGTPSVPSQTGAVFPDPRGAEKRLKTFLYYYSKHVSTHARRPEHDDEPEDDPQEHEGEDDVD
jgi:hypothetical protein